MSSVTHNSNGPLGAAQRVQAPIESLEWWAWSWMPVNFVEDPRTRPGHLALRFALAVSEIELDLDDSLEDYAGMIELPIRQDRLMALAGFRDSSTLDRYRQQLDRWDLVGYKPRRGLPSTYRIRSHWSVGFVYDNYAAVPLGVARDERLSFQARALYVALSVMGEQDRQKRWPRLENGDAQEESPAFPLGCAQDRGELMGLVGFKRTDQLQRFSDELVEAGHVTLTGDRVELTTSVAAEAAWRMEEATEAFS